jgi:hypothetical protein
MASASYLIWIHSSVHAQIRQSLPTAKPRIQSPVTSYEVHGVRDATGPGFSRSFFCHHHSTIAPFSFVTAL